MIGHYAPPTICIAPPRGLTEIFANPQLAHDAPEVHFQVVAWHGAVSTSLWVWTSHDQKLVASKLQLSSGLVSLSARGLDIYLHRYLGTVQCRTIQYIHHLRGCTFSDTGGGMRVGWWTTSLHIREGTSYSLDFGDRSHDHLVDSLDGVTEPDLPTPHNGCTRNMLM